MTKNQGHQEMTKNQGPSDIIFRIIDIYIYTYTYIIYLYLPVGVEVLRDIQGWGGWSGEWWYSLHLHMWDATQLMGLVARFSYKESAQEAGLKHHFSWKTHCFQVEAFWWPGFNKEVFRFAVASQDCSRRTCFEKSKGLLHKCFLLYDFTLTTF